MSTENDHVKAILVGVTDYSLYQGVQDLPLGENDISLMSSALVQGLKISPFHIWAQSRESEHGLGYVTRVSFLEGIRLFLGDIGPEDILIFYFSGHGEIIDGKHYLLFSDGPLETQSLIDLFSELKADKRILFLDCCMSGQFVIDDTKNSGGAEREVLRKGDRQNNWINHLLQGGTAVFASSRREEASGYDPELSASLFTTFLWNAMTNRYYLQNGRLTLDRIRELVYEEAAAWNERHPDRMQHPVFRSTMGGTVFFQVSAYQPYPMQTYRSDQQDYLIAEVSPLHSQIAKRYVVKAVLKHAVTENELLRINKEIVRSVRLLDIYRSAREEQKWKGLPASLVFTYFGHSQVDLGQDNYEFHTTWADDSQDKNQWYRINSHSRIADGILLDTNPDYQWLRAFAENHSADEDTVREKTKSLVSALIRSGEAVIQIVQEYQNGSILTEGHRKQLKEICDDINWRYVTTSDLPIPPADLTKWSLLASNVAGDVQDFSCILSGSERRRSETRHLTEDVLASMQDAVVRFHRDLELLRDEESRIQYEKE